MRFLTTSSDLEAAVSRLLKQCKSLRWAVAWASSHAPGFKLLSKHRAKIEQLTVGTHFYQTDPDFIAEFAGHPCARFVMDPSGIFHPKVYYFDMGGGRWAGIVGSPNFTHGAFVTNRESALLVSDQDVDAAGVRLDILSALDTYRTLAVSVSLADLDAYRAVHDRQQRRLGPLRGTYASSAPTKTLPKSPLAVPIFSETWPKYFASVREDDHHTVEGRLAVLEEAGRLFAEHGSFEHMGDADRQGIAGFARSGRLDWLWFGSMKGAGYFKQAVNQNNPRLSAALDEIPLAGEVRGVEFDAYAKAFASSFERSGVATATRLLAFKRPDYFVCLDSKNRDQLCDAFGIRRSIGLEDYWSAVIERILDSNWWNSPQPEDSLEQRVWRCRTAFLDVRFYAPG